MGDDLKLNHVSLPGDIGSEPDDLNGINSILQWRGKHQADRPAFVFLKDGEDEACRLTYGELDHRASSVAAWIQAHELEGERVLLLYPAGLDFIIGFFGCLYAGAMAVPAYPPHPRRFDPRLDAIFEDCDPKAAFCVQSAYDTLSQQLASRDLAILATDTLTDLADPWNPKSVDLDSIAHIQYTSGSTGDPKGVMVTHRNLLSQVKYLHPIAQYGKGSVHVSWQPFFHDMGLVGSLVYPAMAGAMTVLMSPAAFLRKPIRWLRAITRYRGNGTTAPNFSHDLCVTGTTPEQREGLDLSSWEQAWNGAEPIHASTLDRFCEVFEPYGFRRRTHLPSYGMAETTLCVTASRLDRLPVIASFQRDALEQNRAEPCAEDDTAAIRLVSSGIMGEGVEIIIVEPETYHRCQDGHIGEIWAAGASVAKGYWQRPGETEETFHAHLADSNEGPYLRTGDLGFLLDGELFVTGRLKDMIIIRGRNLYPQDLELVAQSSHAAIQTDACGAFSILVDEDEEIALALEVKRTERTRADFDEVFEAIRSAISENFGVAINWIGLIKPGRIPKTSSGKIMRRVCRRDFLSGDLELLAQWRASEPECDDRQETIEAAAAPKGPGLVQRLKSLLPGQRHQALVTHLQSEIARTLDLRSAPDPYRGFELLGIDSMGAVKLVNHLDDQLENTVDLPTTLLFDQPNIEAVATYLEQALFGDAAQSTEKTGTALANDEPVAIVGLACRFPGAADADEFWRLLDEGQDAIRVVPEDRWDIDSYFDRDAGAPGKMNTRFGGFINGIDGFDAAFFDISPREATSMDPQHRQLLEVSWLALEDAGIAPSTLDGRPVGVFVGISTGDYEKILSAQDAGGADAFSATGNAHSAAVGRLSFLFGLQGPCLAVDTACSSSLVAVHQAVQSLRLGECEMALVGGVNTVLRPDITVAFSRAHLLAPDGRCKTFDAAADGYVRSEGCGMVVLKPLRDAERDGDRVLAVIRGSAVNQDGRSSGLTAPSGPSQTRVIANALTNGGVSPADVQYLECHGTGTVLGDPIEVQAANAILSKGRDADNPLLIGSVKTNLGHMEAAAGIAGLIKVVLALKHGSIPRSLHFQTPNPHIPWKSLAVKVAADAVPWVPDSRQRIAGVSSFGFAGTNAHIVVEETPRVEPLDAAVETESAPGLLAISARTKEALSDLAGRYAHWLQTHDGPSLADICHTANAGRNHFEHRAVLLCTSREGAGQQLEALANGKARPETALGVAPREGRRRVAFLFPGEGLQYSGMARELYENEPVFRDCLDRCALVYDEHARENGSPPLKELMFHPEGMANSQQTRHIRPALYSLQVSLAALWRSWGVLPDAVLGHSAGEYAAACVAGVFSVEEGLRLVMERARLLETLPAGGAMMSVTAPADAVDAALQGDESVSVSAYNGMNTVISGPVERLDALIEHFEKEERYCTKLPATNAAHCRYVEPILDAFETFASGIDYSAPAIPLISGLTGAVIDEGNVPDAGYWRNQTRKPVRFAQGIQALFETGGCDVVLELGPQAELIWLAQMSHRPEHRVLWTSSLEKGQNALEHMLSTAAKLHANGTNLNFAGIEDSGIQYRRLALPTYPFQHVHYWAGPMGGILRSELEEGLYRLCWEESDARPLRPAESRPQRWLILSDDEELGAGIAAELEVLGQHAVTRSVTAAEATATVHLDTLLEDAGRNGKLDQLVLVAGPVVDAGADTDTICDAQQSGVQRALLAAQNLISTKSATRLWLVTRGVHSVIEGEAVDPTHAPVWGFGRTFAVEHPDRFGGLLDLSLQGSAANGMSDLAQTLVSDDGENQVALRAGRRWVARLRPHPLPDSVTVDPAADAAYLITGGTGALGMHLARHLAERGARHIVLTSRSGADDSARAVIRELEESGCRVEVIQADVAVLSEAEGLLDQIGRLADGCPLRGIIHAAGVLAGAPTVSQTPELMSKVMAPKVSGTWNLHRLSVERNLELDFFVLFSSGAALLGFPWQGNYAAANAFMDSLALHRQKLGLPAVSINWGPWAGEGVATRLQALGWEELGTRLISPRTAIQLLDRVGNTPNANICVHPMDWSRWNEQARTGQLAPTLLKLLDELLSPETSETAQTGALRPVSSGGKTGPLVRRLAQLGPIERRSTLLTYMRQQVGAVLGLPAEKIDPEAGFFDLGMNSIMAVELRGSIQTELGDDLEIQAAVIFNHPTVRKISEYLLGVLFPREERPADLSAATSFAGELADASGFDATELAQAIDAEAGQVLGESWVPNTDDKEDDARRRKALAVILSLRAEVARLGARKSDPVAIVGLSCRYPGAAGPNEFWQLLDEARDGITQVPSTRWDNAAWRNAAPDDASIGVGGFLSDVETFDAAFFGISPREARSLDPQHRMLLEVAWEALESANLAPSRLAGTRGGVFVGIQLSDYAQRVNAQDLAEMDAYAGTGNALSAAAGRLAFNLGWQGPALAIDTACSSSLVSLHEACASLRSGECDIALAGGVSLILNPMVSFILSRAQMLSPDGHCKTFDAAANGFVRGEGCGIVVVKRLADARRDGDRVLALIRGTAVNQDGRSSGLTVPNGLAQERVINDALAMAGIDPAAVQYLEAHGTGTSLGDPIEVQAANEVFSRNRDPDHPLLIGSVKSNIGHTETASGIAGVIKVILALQHERIPKNIHFSTPNPHIPWDRLNLKVTAEPEPWPTGENRRIAGVSSFGFAGTNAHIVLEEAPDTTAQAEGPDERSEYLLALSARNTEALAALARRYTEWAGQHDDSLLADLCYTANTGRNHFEERAALVFDSRDQLLDQLAVIEQGLEAAGVSRGRVALRSERRVAFLFTGQGSQRVGMGRELYHAEPVFREHFDRCADEFARLRKDAPDLRELVFEQTGEGLIDQTGYTQPALYALEVSLAALWRSWGVEPDVVIGHSVGEYAAAYTAGVFSLEEGLRLIAERGRLMQALPSGGGMASVSASADIVSEALRGHDAVCIAALNGADTVISGAQAEIDVLIEQFESQGLRCKRLVTSHAFHSKLMDPMLDEFREFAAELSFRAPNILLISNVSGKAAAEDSILGAKYWTSHIKQPVQFERGVHALQELGCNTMLEIGPHPVLVGMGQRCWSSDQEPLWAGSLRRGRRDTHQLLTAAAELYASGVGIDFAAMDSPWRASRHKLDLPFYPFQRQRFWLEASDKLRQQAGPTVQECLYRVAWEPRDVILPRQSSQSETWLILADQEGIGDSLCREIEQSGRNCRLLTFNSDATVTARTLAENLDAAHGDAAAPVTHIVHLWSLDQARADSVDELWRAQAHGVESVLDLMHVLIERQWQGRLWLVTRGVQRILESDGVDTAQSPMWGLGKAIGMEHPELWGGLLDLPQDADVAGADLLASLEGADAEDQVALREQRRWIARLEPAATSDAPQAFSADDARSYLITGGLGGIGLKIADRLVARGARHLVLSGRREPSEAAREVIAQLQARGCRVQVMHADVASEKEVAQLLDRIHDSDLPPLGGIVHTAGVDTVVMLRELDRTELRKTLAAKMVGGWLLDRLAAERELELSLFLCTSSIASVWGSVAQGAYAAANAFLDTLAQQRAASGRAATTVNFGPWSGVGMGTANEEGVAWLRSRGIQALEPGFALDGMETAVAADLTEAVVADVNWLTFRELAELQRPRPLLEKLGKPGTAAEETVSDAQPALLKELADAAPDQRVELLRQVVKAELARILQKPVQELDNDVGFFDLGMDSLMAVEFSKALSAQVGRKLSATVVMDRPDVGTLTAYILDEILALSAGTAAKDEAQLMSEADETETEVDALSADEVESALDDEIKNILG